MRAQPAPLPGDLDRSPFSNGTQWEIWSANVCGAGEGCIHDSTFGQSDEELGAEVNCPLITLSLMQVWPKEWEVRKVPFTTVDGGESFYETPGACTEFRDDLPAEQPDPVIAVDLFGTYAAEPTGGVL